MGDTNMNQVTTEDIYDENLKAFDELYGNLSPHNETNTNDSSGGPTEDPDCTIDDAAKAQFQAKYGDETYYQPFTLSRICMSSTDPRGGLGVNGW